MIRIAEDSFATPSRGQQLLAWLGAIAIVVGLVWMVGLVVWHQFDNQAELDRLQAKASALHIREEDPGPLIQLLAQAGETPVTSLGYAEGASEDEARMKIEQAVSVILSAHQAQILSFVRLPPDQLESIRGLAFETTLMAPTARAAALVAAIESAQPTIIVQKLTLEKRADGLANVVLRGEAYWVAP